MGGIYTKGETMKYMLLLSAIFLTGCMDKPLEKAKGETRHKLFVECMELAAKMPRQADDDVADIVSACSNQAMYMANQLNT
jgi:hypothetical protein